MDTTKTRICYTAIRLFNEKEYDNVSLREIAEAAGTTIGIPPTTLSRRSFCWKPRRNDIKRIFFLSCLISSQGRNRLADALCSTLQTYLADDYVEEYPEICANHKI